MNLEERVAALESRLAMESDLRAAVDEDLSSISQNVRAINHLIQALSINQNDHGELLRKQGAVIDKLQREHGAKLNQIITLLSTLIDTDGQR
ncbi:MAG: hypothetical protein ACRDPW_07605 [Mycobacteriales bacterium]